MLLNDPESEYDRRVNMPRDLNRTRAHAYVLRVWTESIHFRYNLEMFFYLCLTFGFQYLILKFTTGDMEFREQ